MKVKSFYDKDTATFTYVVNDKTSNKCAIIDSVISYDIYSGRTSNKSADQIIDYIKENNLSVEWILETHIHADHLTAASYIKEKIGGKIAIGEGIKEVIKYWAEIFNIAQKINSEASHFDRLFKDGEIFFIGNLEVKVIHTPGHTPACVCYLIEDCIFVGDTIFMPKIGTARTDFPGASAKTLYNSIQKIFTLSDQTKIFVGHDYPQKDLEPQSLSNIAEQKKHNVLINENVSEEQYIEARNKKDFEKAVPKLLLPAIQFNIRAGRFSSPEENGVHYIKIPINKI